MFFAVDPIDWGIARTHLAGTITWPLALAVVDLRYLQDQALRPRGRFPTRRQLAAIWGWSPSKVSRLLVDVDRWSDPAKREAWDAWYEANGRGSKVNQKRFKSGSKVNQKRTKPAAAKLHNAEILNQERTKTEPKVVQERTKSEHRRVSSTTTDTTTATATKENADLIRAWDHYREAWKRTHGASLNRKPPKRSGLSTVIRENGIEKTLDLIDWWETSSDDRAVFLRQKRIGHSTLFRPSKAASYIAEWVEPWRNGLADRFTNPKPDQAEPGFARRFRVFRGLGSDVIEGQ